MPPPTPDNEPSSISPEDRLDKAYRQLEKTLFYLDNPEPGERANALEVVHKLFARINSLQSEITGSDPRLNFASLIHRLNQGSSGTEELDKMKAQCQEALAANEALKKAETILRERLTALHEENQQLTRENKELFRKNESSKNAHHEGGYTSNPSSLCSAFNGHVPRHPSPF